MLPICKIPSNSIHINIFQFSLINEGVNRVFHCIYKMKMLSSLILKRIWLEGSEDILTLGGGSDGGWRKLHK